MVLISIGLVWKFNQKIATRDKSTDAISNDEIKPTITEYIKETSRENKIEIEQVKGNDFIDLNLSSNTNVSALEVGIVLPEDLGRLELTNQALFDDVFDHYDETTKILKIGALSNQVVSPKQKAKFIRIQFDKPVESDLSINYQIILDQNGNEL